MTDIHPAEQPGDPLEGSAEEVRVTDKRRIDPVTGQRREQPSEPSGPASAAAPASAGAAAGSGPTEGGVADGADEALATWAADGRVAELTADLQRVSAEYANYRKRMERDRQVAREQSIAAVLTELLPTLDDLERAREHGELTGTFKAVGDGLTATLAKLGLEPFGEVGDLFDPTMHEAMTHSEGEGLEAPICSQIYQTGFRYRDRVIRPARVAVSE